MDTFERDVQQFIKNLDNSVVGMKQDLASQAYRRVIHESPVLTGAYVLSNNIGVNEIDSSVAKIPGISKIYQRLGLIPTASAINQKMAFKAYQLLVNQLQAVVRKAKKTAKNKALRKLGLLKKAQNVFDEIVISNSIHYADKVEYIGWSRTGPYHPYGKAKAAIRVRQPLGIESNAP